jgi:hypothetical protein
MISSVVLLCTFPALSQTAPPGWKTVKDAKSTCQIAVPPEWEALGGANGAVVLHDPETAIAVVTSQPGQEFKPLPPGLLKAMAIPKDKMFENSAKRIFYQDRTSANENSPNGFSSSVPAKDGTCSCHVTALPSIPEDTAKKILLSLAPVPGKT